MNRHLAAVLVVAVFGSLFTYLNHAVLGEPGSGRLEATSSSPSEPALPDTPGGGSMSREQYAEYMRLMQIHLAMQAENHRGRN